MTRRRWYCFILNYSSPQPGFVFEMCIRLQSGTIPSDFQATYMYIRFILQMQYIPEEVIIGFHEG